MIGLRIDKALSKLVQGHSRSAIQSWIKQEMVIVDDEQPNQKDKVYGGEVVEINVPEIRQGEWQAQDVEFEIVHRLDKCTSGLMVVARSEFVRLGLIEQLVDHSLHREYLALVNGMVISGRTVEESIARDRGDRRKMAVNALGKRAITHFRVDQRFNNHTLLRVRLETGRTHQIRVHMNHVGFPLVGDQVYGRRLAIPGDCEPILEAQLRSFKRQALHATRIQYLHPSSGELESWDCPLPDDMQALVGACALDSRD